jgi:type I restriction enzyme R subunit
MPAPAHDESEATTRRKRIDPALQAQGWDIVPFVEGRPLSAYAQHAIAEYPTENGPADYALVVNGQLLGVVEAKRLAVGPQEVLTQAERYSRGVADSPFNFRGFHVPFLYSTNGEKIRFHDVRHEQNLSRWIEAFHTPAALVEMLGRDTCGECQRLLTTPNTHPRLRDYQRDANTAIEQAIDQRKRKLLVAMATGTGKTFTMVNEIYRLMKSGVGRRILFLVDRRALAAQAVRAFASFEPEPGLKFDKIYEVYSQRFHRDDLDDDTPFDPTVLPREYLCDPRPGHAFVYVCTIQRMAINLLGRQAVMDLGDDDPVDDDAERLKIPIHAFDIIVADECHRGYTAAAQSVWRQTLDHFDGIKIGLTATPAAHTTAYFKEVVFRYEYERAVREGYLVDYDVVKVKSDVRMEGMFLSEGEQVALVDTDSGNEQRDLLEDEREFADTEIERKATSPDSNRKIMEELKKYAAGHEQRYRRFPKTLIFANNDLPHVSHADQLVEIARETFGRGETFVQKITGRVDRPLRRIREFRNRREPGIAVSVDLMSTGVDIPDLEFIVFLRPVKSRILFEQMLGRGTRKGERFRDKSHFVVFDCFDGTLLKYFRDSTAITAQPPDQPSKTIQQIIDDIWANRDRDYNIRCLVKRLQRIEKEMDGSARDLFAAYIPDGDMGRFARELPDRLRRDFVPTMGILRNESFQGLLVSYPRRKDPFVVAVDHRDTVSSEYLIRDGRGREYKPADYLAAFAEFIRENPAQIGAIEILLNRPADWRTDVLVELKTKLTTAPERFTVENLQMAHEACYRKALVEIISMVKHAADEHQPLLTAEERVSRAFDTVTAGRSFTPDQQQWLDRIKAHLVANLSIEQDDFDVIPVLESAGGWGNANRAFGGKLAALLGEINNAIAA